MWKVQGWAAKGGTADRKPGEITDNGPRELEIGRKIGHEGKKNVSTSTRRKATESDDEGDQITITDVTPSGYDG
jgi:hypothetical protein